jgi:hypothetical protein
MENLNNVGKGRFIYFLEKTEVILKAAATSENPARLIYSEDMRTALFMLEGLSRIYRKVYPHQKLKKLNKKLKEIEDFLGAIDFYDDFHKQFAENKNIPSLITDYAGEQAEKNIKAFNKFLKKEEWLGNQKSRLKKIYKKLNAVDWFNERCDAATVKEVYENEIKKVIEKYKDNKNEFTDIEKDVHELRRQLRWLSIYPQALCGLMQLSPHEEPPEFLKKYLTPEIINSKFNVMPDGSALQNHIMLDRNYFYALSCMIAELGTLKDGGLKIDLIEEGLTKVYKASSHTDELAYSFCDENQLTIPQILRQSQSIARTFFDENILENLIRK